MATTLNDPYPARLDIDYPEGERNRLTTLVRLILVIPIALLIGILSANGTWTWTTEAGETVTRSGGGIVAGLALATGAMIVVRQRYPRWWFDFAVEFTRFGNRVGAYFALLSDQYPSTVEHQSVHIEVDYPDVEQDLNRWLPIVKWILAIPHFLVLIVLSVLAVLATIVSWFAILITGNHPRPLFDFVVGVARWWLRVEAYASLLVTDRYPPFSLD